MGNFIDITSVCYTKNIQFCFTIAVVDNLEILYRCLSYSPMKVKHIGLRVIVPYGSFVM